MNGAVGSGGRILLALLVALLMIVGDASTALAVADTSLAGIWVDGSGTVFNMEGSDAGGYTGQIIANPAAAYCLPANIRVSGAGGEYSGTVPFYRVPCNTDVHGGGSTFVGLGSTRITVDGDGSTAHFSIAPPSGLSCGNCVPTTWTRTGLSLGEVGGARNLGSGVKTCSIAKPVNCATGVFWHTFTDTDIPGSGVPLQVTRTYSSASASTTGPLGYGWTGSYGMRVSFDASGNATVTQENGATVSFVRRGARYIGLPWVLATLVADAGGTFTFTRFATNDKYVFNPSGQLVSEVDRNGHASTVAYDASGHPTMVTDHAGRSVTFSYSGGHLVSSTDPVGNTTSYAYSPAGDLTSTVDPLGRTWRFTYDAKHRLLSMKDPRGGTTTNAYDSADRVTRQVGPAGRATTWSYSGDPTSASGGTTTSTDPRGIRTEYGYTNLELRSVTAAAGTAEAATTAYLYDPETRGRARITDPNGHVTTQTFNSRGDTLTATDPVGNVTRSTYNSAGDRLTVTDPLGTTTSYAYDGKGNLLSQSTPLSGGGTATWSFTRGSGAASGDMLSSRDPDGNTTTYGYDAAGDQTSATDPLGRQTTRTYDAVGRLLTTTTPNGNTTTHSYDAGGELAQTTDPLGRSTRYRYDADGNRTSRTDANGHTTTYEYDADDEPTRITRPDGSARKTTYDGDGNVLTQSDGNGHTTTYTYDRLNRVATTTDPGGHRTTNTYDRAGNLVASVGPSGRRTSYTYDADDRITVTEFSDGITPKVTADYDADGHRTSLTDGTGTSRFTYDTLGHLTGHTNGAGATTGYAYDKTGRVTRLTYPNGKSVDKAYDGAGDLTSVTDWLGHTSTFGYDGDRNLTHEGLPGSVTATSTFDAADRLSGITDRKESSTLARFSYTRDAIGRLTGSTASGSLSGTDSYSYDANGRLTGENGATYRYDAGDNPTSYIQNRPQTFDPADELQTSGAGSSGGVPWTPAAVAVAARASTHRIGKHRTLSTRLPRAAGGALVLAFVSAQGPNNAAQGIATPKSPDVTWRPVTTARSRGGTVGIWQARAGHGLTRMAVTARLRRPSSQAQLTVIAFDPGATLGGQARRAGVPGAPQLALHAPAGAQVWAVGHDAASGARLVPVRPGHLAEQIRSARNHAASWVQDTSVAKAGLVTIGARARNSRKWSLAAAVVRPAAGTSASAPGISSGGAAQRTFTYNADGDRTGITTNGTTVSLGYDQANRLTSISGGKRYSYDGDGLRASKTSGGTTTRFTWDESGPLPLLLQDGDTSYIYGPAGHPIEQITGTTPTYILADQQGSTRLLTDDSGAVVGAYSYDAWGNVTGHTGVATTNLRYGGQYTDSESGLIYLRARYYDPTTGQFITRDPLLAVTHSGYGYVSDDPLNRADPTGMAEPPPDESAESRKGEAWLAKMIGGYWAQLYEAMHPQAFSDFLAALGGGWKSWAAAKTLDLATGCDASAQKGKFFLLNIEALLTHNASEMYVNDAPPYPSTPPKAP